MSSLSDNALVRTALRRPVMMLMVLASMIVLGAIALARIPLELIPSGFSAPFMSVHVSYPDATARDVEEKITRPLEQALATTPGLARIDSASSSGVAAGRGGPGGAASRIILVFDSDVDMDIAYRQVRDRVSRARPELPDEVREVQINKQSGESLPVAFYGVIWDAELADPDAVIDRHLVRAVERIDGVGLVNLWGRQDTEVRIEVDRALADAAGIDMVALAQKLGTSNFTMASGEVQDAAGEYLLRSVAAWESIEDIEQVVVGPEGLRLRDIATVTFGRPEVTRYDRYNGRPSLVMAVVKESQANTVEVCDAIKQAVEEARQHPDLQGIDIEPVFIQGDTIRYSLQQVVESGRQGGILALFVLIFFLRRVRLTVIIALSIPLSLFLSLPFMYFTDQTINLVSLVGLMICIGLVVDNSVVVAENIGRYRRRGLGPYAAALQGAGEVALAITLATTTTIVVFLPAALLSEGMTQFLMVRMVTPVCVSLAASLFVALVLIPLASATLLGDRPPSRSQDMRGFRRALAGADEVWKRVAGRAYEATMGRINAGYTRLLRGALRRRMDVVMAALFALGSMAVPLMNVQCASGQNFGTRRVTVNYSMPSDTTLEEANAFFLEIEGLLDRIGDEYRVSGQYLGFDADSGQVQVFFDPPEPDEPPFEEFATDLVDQLPQKPGWRKTSQFGDSDGARDDALRFAIYGDEHDRVQAAKVDLEEQLLQIDGVIGLHTDGEDTRQRDELALTIDRTTSERYGVPSRVVANTVAYAIRGTPLPRYHTDEREVDVWLRYQEADREDIDQLLGYQVPTTAGKPIPIHVLADKHVAQGESRLTRTNKRVGAVIALDLDSDERRQTMAKVAKFLEEYQLPEGLTFDPDGEAREVSDMQRDLIGAVGLGTIFIFLLMGFLFESFVLPLSVLPSIPLSFVGVWWFLYLTGESIDPLAGIGIVLLLGVVVNNAIVLVDFIQGARAAGMERTEAIVQAGKLRFRPIMMTALTTIGGMIPLAFTEHTGEGIPYGAFGKTLVGGMITATVLTLVVVPVTYTFLDDVRSSAARWWVRIVRSRR